MTAQVDHRRRTNNAMYFQATCTESPKGKDSFYDTGSIAENRSAMSGDVAPGDESALLVLPCLTGWLLADVGLTAESELLPIAGVEAQLVPSVSGGSSTGKCAEAGKGTGQTVLALSQVISSHIALACDGSCRFM